MNNIKFLPNIRFRKFEKRWKTEKLEELGNTFPSLSGKSKKDFGHGNAKYITYMNVFTNPIASMSGTEAIEIDKKQNSVKYGDVLFTMSSETPEEVGMSSVWEYHAKNVYLNSFSFGFRPNSEFDLNFLAFLLRSQGVRRQIVILAQGISRFNISKVKMMGINVTFPTNLFEQQKIGDFFSKLDKLLDLQQQKIDKLELLKKALLQKLFPKHDAKIPELRFKGCDGEWEDCLVGNLLEVVPNKEYITEASKKGLNPVIQQGEKPILGFSNKTPYKEYKKVVLFGDHTVSLYKPESPFLIATDGIKILYVKDWNGHFLFAFLQKYKPDSEGYKRHFSILKSKKAKFTIIDEEQQKIGNLLSKVDQLIELENKKLQNFQQVKKCLLQNMFVE
ncbi:type I restriction enzyme, S subunit [Lactobacillus apis]|uniref:restriction endonuclease subunit S n=1 Tax=Lactobacillus apis TaxID=303541 RepID=UPI000815794C|nr:restriction endonuclease subunit S [Lactobacillus apis]GGG35120.1 hypothetical protein GCM10007323_06520 [Lactobacillus apis]SCB84351.1 type I restriction enzyme, S subunit [Lactobacillus apis]